VFIFGRRRTENTNAIWEKTAGLRSGNFSDLNSACSKMLVTVKIFQFQDMLKENRFLGIFLGQGKRPILYSIQILQDVNFTQ
jgi:CRISPR/Cas system CMR-associated protein Cmr3 (group 5 of RAMP superfamily)